MNDSSVSIVIASIVGAPFLDRCLASLEAQARARDAEVIVVLHGTEQDAGRVAEAFPWVTVIYRKLRETVPSLRRHGVERAAGEIIAVIEEHCTAAPDWLDRIVESLADDRYGAVGGAIHDDDYRRLRDWLVYFVEYNGWLPPAPRRSVAQLNGANIAYRRRHLTDHVQLLDDGYWEVTLHPRLLAAGVEFLSVPEMVVRHTGPFNLGYYLQQRYWFSQAYAGARAQASGIVRRVIFMLTAPLLPIVLWVRMTLRVLRKRRRVVQYLMIQPLLLAALTALAAGEFVGYTLGSGDALSKVE